MRAMLLVISLAVGPWFWANSVVAEPNFRAKIRINCRGTPCIESISYYKLKLKIWLGNELIQDSSYNRYSKHYVFHLPESAPTKARWKGKKWAGGWSAVGIPVKVELWAWKKSDGSLHTHQILQGKTRSGVYPSWAGYTPRLSFIVWRTHGPFNAKGRPAINDPNAVWRVEVEIKIHD